MQRHSCIHVLLATLAVACHHAVCYPYPTPWSCRPQPPPGPLPGAAGQGAYAAVGFNYGGGPVGGGGGHAADSSDSEEDEEGDEGGEEGEQDEAEAQQEAEDDRIDDLAGQRTVPSSRRIACQSVQMAFATACICMHLPVKPLLAG